MSLSFRTNGNFIDFVNTDATSLNVETVIMKLHNTSRCIDWSLPADTTKISFTIDEVKYSNISITEIDFDGTVMNSQDDFETGITGMFEGLAGGGGSGGGVESVTGDAVDNTDPLNPVINSTGGGYLIADVTLTDAQIKAIPTTPPTIIPAPGAGKAIICSHGVIIGNFTAGAYTNVTEYSHVFKLATHLSFAQLMAGWTTELFTQAAIVRSPLAPLVEPDGNEITGSNHTEVNDNTIENKQVITECNNSLGNYTGGNAANTMRIIVYYTLIDV